MTDEPHWQLALAFPDGSPSFCHGFEAGRIWERMKLRPWETIEQTVADENREMLVRIAEATGWAAKFDPLTDDGWEVVTLIPPDKRPQERDQ